MENDNKRTAAEESDGRDEYLAGWEIGILTVILIVTLLGNGLVLFALRVRKHPARRKITRMYFFIMHLSIADLITGLFDVLPQLAWDITFRFQGGAVLCKVIKFLQPLGPYLSTYVLMATAIDRYHAICHPLSYRSTTSGRSKLMVCCAWVIAVTLCLPQVFVFSYQEISRNVWDCWATFEEPYGERAYVTWYSFTVFLLPFLVLVYTYTGICLRIWKSNEISGMLDQGTEDRGNRTPIITRAMITTVKQTITVISFYVITSTPFIGCLLWATWDPDAVNSQFHQGPAFTILTLLNSLTSCVNPWIYLFFNRELRAALVNQLRRKDDVSTTHEQETHRRGSDEASFKSTLMTRISRYSHCMTSR